MQTRRTGIQTNRIARLVDEQQRGDLSDAGFHRRQADQLAVELLEHLGDAALTVERREVAVTVVSGEFGRRDVGGGVHWLEVSGNGQLYRWPSGFACTA